MSSNTAVVEATATEVAAAEKPPAKEKVPRVKPSRTKPAKAKAANAAKTLKAVDKAGGKVKNAPDPKPTKTRASGASTKSLTSKASSTAAKTAPKRAVKASAGLGASYGVGKNGSPRQAPGPKANVKPGEPPTPAAKKPGKNVPNAGPAVMKAIEFFGGSRVALARFLGVHGQNIGRIIQSHKAGWAEKIADRFVARLSSVSGVPPCEINPQVFVPGWKAPKITKAEAFAAAGLSV